MADIPDHVKKRLLAAPDDTEFDKHEAAVYLGHSKRNLERWISAGAPPPYRRDPSSKMIYYRKGDLNLWRHPKKHLHAYLATGDTITAHAAWDDPEAILAPIEELLDMQWADLDLMKEALRIYQAEQQEAWDEARMRVAEAERDETLAAIGSLPDPKARTRRPI